MMQGGCKCPVLIMVLVAARQRQRIATKDGMIHDTRKATSCPIRLQHAGHVAQRSISDAVAIAAVSHTAVPLAEKLMAPPMQNYMPCASCISPSAFLFGAMTILNA